MVRSNCLRFKRDNAGSAGFLLLYFNYCYFADFVQHSKQPQRSGQQQATSPGCLHSRSSITLLAVLVWRVHQTMAALRRA